MIQLTKLTDQMPDLIAHEDLISIANLNSLVEARKTKNGIDDVHRELKKILGSTGYAIVYDNAPSYAAQAPNTALYIELYGYIQRFMAWKALQLGTIDLFAETDKAGTFKKSGEDYAAVTQRELSQIENTRQGRAEARLEDLLYFLRNNETVFTWYGTNVNDEERITLSSRSTAGISFRRAIKQDPYRG